MEFLTHNSSLKPRRATLHGREYLVAPLTMIVPGVLNGSKGALYYPPEEISKNYTAWNGMPLVLRHPVINGTHVSARDPRVSEEYEVGRVYNSRISKQGKLQAEGWFEINRLGSLDKATLNRLERGEPIELSTGLFTDNEAAPHGSSYRGKSYDYIAKNYVPDHLAVLPDQQGACSIKDGCGVMVNQRRLKANKKKHTPGKIKANAFCPTGEGGGQDNSCSSKGESSYAAIDKEVAKYTTYKQLTKKIAEYANRDTTLDEDKLLMKLHNAARKKASTQEEKDSHERSSRHHFTNILEAGYKAQGKKYKAGDSMIGVNATKHKFQGDYDMKLNEKQKKEIVDSLIANVCCWKEEDRETLNALSDETLSKLQEAGKQAKENELAVNEVKKILGDDKLAVDEMPAALKKKMEEKMAAKEGEEEDEEEEVMNKKPGCNEKVANAAPKTTEEWMKSAPSEVQDAVRNAMRIDAEEKAKLITAIVANANNPFTKEQLQAKKTDELRNLAKLAGPVVNKDEGQQEFFGMASPFTVNREAKVDREDILPLPTLNFDNDKK